MYQWKRYYSTKTATGQVVKVLGWRLWVVSSIPCRDFFQKDFFNLSKKAGLGLGLGFHIEHAL